MRSRSLSIGLRLLLLSLWGLFTSAQAQQSRPMVRVSQGVVEASQGRYAVIVGVDQYEDPAIQDLKFAANDARAVAEALILSGAWRRDQVIVMTPDAPDARKPTRNNILAELGRLSSLQGADTVLFYFSGHGSASNRTGDRENYIYPMDTRPSVPEDTAVSVRRVHQVLNELDATRKIAIFDACRNQIEAGTRGSGSGGMWSDPKYSESAGLRVLYATCFECFSWEDEEAGLGVMTRHMIDGLNGAADGADNSVTDGVIGFDELYSYLYASVVAWSNRSGHRQIPTLSGEMSGGDFAIVPVVGQMEKMCPSDGEAVDASTDAALDAWRGADPEAFGATSRRAEAQLRCLQERIRPETAASFHELVALTKFEVQDEPAALDALRAAAQVRPGRPPLTSVEEKPRTLEALVEIAASAPPKFETVQRAPRGVRYEFDGDMNERPSDRPTVAQAVNCRKDIQWTRWLRAGEPLPATASAHCASGARTALGLSAAGAALSAGGLYLASALVERSFYELTAREDPLFDADNGGVSSEYIREEADYRARAANVLGYAAQGAGGVAVGLGLGFGLTFAF